MQFRYEDLLTSHDKHLVTQLVDLAAGKRWWRQWLSLDAVWNSRSS